MKRCGKLHHDRGGDIGHDAQRDEAHALQAAARESVEQVQDTAAGMLVQIVQDQRIDAGQRHKAEEAEYDQRTDRKPDALLEFRRLGEIGEAQIARNIIGA